MSLDCRGNWSARKKSMYNGITCKLHTVWPAFECWAWGHSAIHLYSADCAADERYLTTHWLPSPTAVLCVMLDLMLWKVFNVYYVRTTLACVLSLSVALIKRLLATTLTTHRSFWGVFIKQKCQMFNQMWRIVAFVRPVWYLNGYLEIWTVSLTTAGTILFDAPSKWPLSPTEVIYSILMAVDLKGERAWVNGAFISVLWC